MNTEVVNEGWKPKHERIAKGWVLGLTVAAIIVWAVYEVNMAPLVVSLAWYAWLGVHKDEPTYQLGRNQRYERRTFFLTHAHAWKLAGAPLCALVASQFVFIGWPFADYHALTRGSGESSYYGPFVLTPFNPFTDTVRYYRVDQSVKRDIDGRSSLVCTGRTIDGRGVWTEVAAQMNLPFSGLPSAHKVAGSQAELTTKSQGELCQRFAAAVSRYPYEGLPQSVVIESKAVEGIYGMNNLGIRYSGAIWSSAVHVNMVE